MEYEMGYEMGYNNVCFVFTLSSVTFYHYTKIDLILNIKDKISIKDRYHSVGTIR